MCGLLVADAALFLGIALIPPMKELLKTLAVTVAAGLIVVAIVNKVPAVKKIVG